MKKKYFLSFFVFVALLSVSFGATYSADAKKNPNIPPVADIGTDGIQTYINTAVWLSCAASSDVDGTIEDCKWEFPGGNNLHSITPFSQSFSTPGEYIITLRVTDNDGATDTDTVTITVLPANILPIANAGQDVQIYVGEETVLNGGSSSDEDGTIASYAWKLPYDQTASGVTTPFATTTPGIYEIKLIVTDNSAGVSEPDTVIVTAIERPNIAPIANAGSDVEIFVGDETVLSGSGSTDEDGTIASYAWKLPYDQTASGVTTPFTTTTPGIYEIKLIVTDNDEATSEPDTVIITVKAKPVVTPTPTPVVQSGGGVARINNEMNSPTCSVSGKTATVTWTTSKPSDGRIVLDPKGQNHVSFGEAPSYGYTLYSTLDSRLTTSHSITYTLPTNGTWYGRAVSNEHAQGYREIFKEFTCDTNLATIAPVPAPLPPVPSEECSLVNEKPGVKTTVEEMNKIEDFFLNFFNEKITHSLREFQAQFTNEILKPWGLKVPTEILGVTSKHQINNIYCGRDAGLSKEQLSYIEKHK